MKATLFAVVLLLFAMPLLAAEKNTPPSALPSIDHHIIKINLNTADVAVLTGSFKGIGKKRAEAIVNYRQQHGNFKSVAELAEVRGLSQSFVNKNLLQLQGVFAVG